MGTSLYEQYQRESKGGQKPETLYEKYQREKAQTDSDALFREHGLLNQRAEPLALDVTQPSESTRGAPYDPTRGGDMAALKSAPRAFPSWVKEGAGPTAALALTAAQGVPGMEALEAGAGMLGSKLTDHPLSFAESRDALREESGKIPSEIRATAKLAGSALTLPLVAGLSPLKAGAALGAADQGLSADSMSLEDRLARAAIGGTAGGTMGKALETGGTLARAVTAKPFTKQVNTLEDAMAATDKVNYGKAAQAMAAGGGTSPAIQSAFSDPVVVPFVKAVRASQQFANADDATVLREAYKLMSERQRALGGRIVNSEDFKAGSSLEKADIDAAKKRLLQAAGPEFQAAVEGHRTAEGTIAAAKHGKEAARQAIGKLQPSGKRQIRLSPDALKRKAPSMSLEDRLAAEQAVLAQLKRSVGIEPNAISGMGTLTSLIRPSRVAPLLRELGTPTQKKLDDLIRLSLAGSGALTP